MEARSRAQIDKILVDGGEMRKDGCGEDRAMEGKGGCGYWRSVWQQSSRSMIYGSPLPLFVVLDLLYRQFLICFILFFILIQLNLSPKILI